MESQFESPIVMSMDELYLELEKKNPDFKRELSPERLREIWDSGKYKYNTILSEGFKKIEHRVIWEKINGKIPYGMVIHHINGIKKDNRIENLQLVTFNEHMAIHKNIKKEKLIRGNE